MKRIILLIVLLSAISVFGQIENNSTEIQSYSDGRITTTDSQVKRVKDITIEKNTLSYFDIEAETKTEIAMNKVLLIEKYDGNYSTSGYILGSLVGIAGGVAIAVGSEETKTTSDGVFQTTTTEIQTWPIWVGSLLGAVIGGAIGASIDDWETVYDGKIALKDRMNIFVNTNKKLDGVTLSLTWKL